MDAREKRLNKQPTWKGSITRAALAAVLMFIFLLLIDQERNRIARAVAVRGVRDR